MFHNIYYDRSVVKLPHYLVPIPNADRARFRANIRPPERFGEAEYAGVPDANAIRNNRFDDMSLKCSVEAKARSFKSSFFFRTHLKWNDLPTELKHQNESVAFQTSLKQHMWDIVLDPH